MSKVSKSNKKKNKIEVEITSEMPAGYKDDSKLWESRQLGATMQYAAAAPTEIDAAIDDSLGLLPISIRLQKRVIEQLKELAKQEGLGYQPYVRQILTRHINEAKQSRR